jgi:hypothetical protein
MMKARLLALCVGLAVLFPPPAPASCPRVVKSLAQWYEQAEVVFVGHVLDVADVKVNPPPGFEGVNFAEYTTRFQVEIVQSQMTKTRRLATGADRHDVADLDLLVGHHDTIDEQFHQHPLLLEGRLGQPGLDSATEILDRSHHAGQLDVSFDLGLELDLLLGKRLALLFQIGAPAAVFLQWDDLAQVRLRHSLDLVVEAGHAPAQTVTTGVEFLRKPVARPRPLEGSSDHVRMRHDLA